MIQSNINKQTVFTDHSLKYKVEAYTITHTVHTEMWYPQSPKVLS